MKIVFTLESKFMHQATTLDSGCGISSLCCFLGELFLQASKPYAIGRSTIHQYTEYTITVQVEGSSSTFVLMNGDVYDTEALCQFLSTIVLEGEWDRSFIVSGAESASEKYVGIDSADQPGKLSLLTAYLIRSGDVPSWEDHFERLRALIIELRNVCRV